MSDKKIDEVKKGTKEIKYSNYQSFTELEGAVNLRKLNDHMMNFRMPASMNALIEADIAELIKAGIYVSKNDYMVLMLMVVLNFSFNAESKNKVYRTPNSSSMTNFIEEHGAEILKEVMFRTHSQISEKYLTSHRKKTAKQFEKRKLAKLQKDTQAAK